MIIQKHQLEFLTIKESLSLIKSGKLIKTITDSEHHHKSELYLVNEHYVEAVYDLLEDGEFSYLIEVTNLRLKEFNHIDDKYNFTSE